MNHEKVSVLDGGLPRYRVEGLELDEKPLTREEEGLAPAQSDGQVRLLFKLAFIIAQPNCCRSLSYSPTIRYHPSSDPTSKVRPSRCAIRAGDSIGSKHHSSNLLP
jgi:hypothetical protein